MRKPKQDIVLTDVEIVDAAAEGNAIAKVDGMVVFVPFVVPGDIVDLRLIKKKKNYAEARAIAVKRPSPLRSEPQCQHFGVCGGCKWQNMQYDAQLRYKEQLVRDVLQRIGRISTQGMRPICGSDDIFYYRNKLEFTFSNKRWRTDDELRAAASSTEAAGGEAPAATDNAVGFHVPTVFDKVLPIEHCALQRDPSNAIRLFVRDYALQHHLSFYDIRNHCGFLRNIVIRCTSTGQWMVILVVAEPNSDQLFPLLDALQARFPQITSLQYIVNTKLNDSYTDQQVVPYRGTDHIVEEMTGYDGDPTLRFTINPKSFYQTNSAQARKLYGFVAEFADLQGNETVYDLYTGTGTIALFLASRCRKVVGIEYVEEAIADAKANAILNNIGNATFHAGDMAKVLTADFIAANGTPDVVVTDPPRAGMHERVIEQLLQCQPSKIVYVSCNPATQARDLALLAPRYMVARIQPVDMFPHTQHVENVAELLLTPTA